MLILGISFHASAELSTMQASNRYNYITASRRRVESSIVGKDERDELVARAERVLGNEGLGIVKTDEKV
jgi:hypothetical protein